MLDQLLVASQMAPTFQEALKAHLKNITKVSNISNMLICQLHYNGKSTNMRFNTYIACHQEWSCHLNRSYLNMTIVCLTN
eukprot:4270781-Ditylum_brightwellii.AAC.1